VDKLTIREPYHGHDKVYTANGAGMHISHIGQASLPTHTSKQLHLTNVLQVPSVTRNLLSVRKLTRDNNVFVEFHPSDVFVKVRETTDILLSGHSHHGLYDVSLPGL
jgi:hypothetical protein